MSLDQTKMGRPTKADLAMTEAQENSLVLVTPAELSVYIAEHTNNLKDIVDELVRIMLNPKTGARIKRDVAALLFDRALGSTNKAVLEAAMSSDGQVVIRFQQ